MNDSDLYFMRQAMEEAKKAFDCNDVPVGCVIVYDGKIIGRGYNCKYLSKLATKHAEIVAIEQACKYFGDWRLNGCSLYTTLEPCMMCMGAIVESRIKNVIFSLKREDEQMYSVGDVNIVGGICSSESHDLLKKFFDLRRK